MSQQKFAVFDIDGTFFRNSLYFQVIWDLIRNNHLDAEFATELTDYFSNWQNRKDEDDFWRYAEYLISGFESRVSTVPYPQFKESVRRVFENEKDHIYVYTKDLHQKLQASGYKTYAISGSHHEIVELFAQYYGFDGWVGSKHEVKNGRFTGKINQIYRDKSAMLRSLIERNDLTLTDSFAIGDTANDHTILKEVEHPIAFNPDKKLLKIAKNNAWKIVVERKNVIYELVPENGTYRMNSNE